MGALDASQTLHDTVYTYERPASMVYSDLENSSATTSNTTDFKKQARFFKSNIEFDQRRVLMKVAQDNILYKDLENIMLRFNGLCELISNYIILNDLLGQPQARSNQQLHISNFSADSAEKNLLKLKITPNALNKPIIKNSHILDITSFFQKLLAFFFNIYPFSLFSCMDNLYKDKKVNEPLIEEKFTTLDDGQYIKFMVFEKGFFSFTGHSMLVKKTGDSFSFFDPNQGEYPHLNIPQLCEKINEAMLASYEGIESCTHMCFIDATKFVKDLVFYYETDLNDVPSDNPLLQA